MDGFHDQPLPRAAPARVLAFGAYLKNAACLLEGTVAHWSPLHDDLSTPEACRALADSTQVLVDRAGGPIAAVAHDLHPDFHSTRLALAWADRLGVPAVAVQHHAAHIGVVQAEQGHGIDDGCWIGLALDGVGLGHDGQAWGGEVLAIGAGACERVAHLPALALAGGDVAAREPWRLVAAVLHATGRADEIVPRLGSVVGDARAAGLAQMLARDIHCPRSTAAGRWFDAAAGALRLSVRQCREAEAAVALEQAASAWLAARDVPPQDGVQATGTASDVGSATWAVGPPASDDPRRSRGAELAGVSLDAGGNTEDLAAFVASLCDESDVGRGAARFHHVLARRLVREAVAAAHARGTRTVALAGGCFHNRLLSRLIDEGLRAAGMTVWRPGEAGPGDAGLALGQAWIAAWATAGQPARRTSEIEWPTTPSLCAPRLTESPAPRAATLEN
jgi:hydrogenase maturation protein HypF